MWSQPKSQEIIEHAISESARQIKQVLLQQAKRIEKFPAPDYITHYDYEKDITYPDGIVVLKPGIIIVQGCCSQRGDTHRGYVIFEPDGLRHVLPELIVDLKTGENKTFPIYASGSKCFEGYVTYGLQTLRHIEDILEREKWDRKLPDWYRYDRLSQ